MYTTVGANGKITIKAGDRIVPETLVDAHVALSACSVSECDTNACNCTALAAEVR